MNAIFIFDFCAHNSFLFFLCLSVFLCVLISVSYFVCLHFFRVSNSFIAFVVFIFFSKNDEQDASLLSATHPFSRYVSLLFFMFQQQQQETCNMIASKYFSAKKINSISWNICVQCALLFRMFHSAKQSCSRNSAKFPLYS